MQNEQQLVEGPAAVSGLPEEPASLDSVFASLVDQARRMEEQANLNRASWYRQAVQNWDRNYVVLGYDGARTEEVTGRKRANPPLMIHYTAQRQTFSITASEGPEFVAAEIPLPVKSQAPPPGHIEFGPRVFGWHTLAYYAGNSQVPPGTETTRQDQRFVLVELGVKGTLFHRLLWEIVQ